MGFDMNTILKVIMLTCSLLASLPSSAMIELDDSELSIITGQALMQMNKEVVNGYAFYKAGLDAVLELNMNIGKLQLGCGGANQTGSSGCDLDIDHFSLGCITNAIGQCISLNPEAGTNQKPGLLRDCGTGTCTGTGTNTSIQNDIKDFVINRPFFQFAIKNDGSRTNREVVGIRLGGEDVSGPMSFGSLNSFSGYMTGTADVFMRGETDVAATCVAPNVCPNTAGRTKFPDASAFLGLNDAEILNLGIVAISYEDLTMDYDSQSREDVQASVDGNRLSQIGIPDLRLADLVDDIVDTVEVNRICADGLFGCSIIANDTIANTLLPLLKGGISDYIKQELATGLGLADANDLNSHVVPFNLKNIHQLDVATPQFGLSFQKEAVQYPGYAKAVARGWSMYAPDAFNLVIDDKVSAFVQAIAGSSDARDGNITGLPASYRNCWGTARFC